MTLRNDLERAIYAAAYVARFEREFDKGMPGWFTTRYPDTTERNAAWQECCAGTAVDDASALASAPDL